MISFDYLCRKILTHFSPEVRGIWGVTYKNDCQQLLLSHSFILLFLHQSAHFYVYPNHLCVKGFIFHAPNLDCALERSITSLLIFPPPLPFLNLPCTLASPWLYFSPLDTILWPSAHKILQELPISFVSVKYHYCYYF